MRFFTFLRDCSSSSCTKAAAAAMTANVAIVAHTTEKKPCLCMYVARAFAVKRIDWEGKKKGKVFFHPARDPIFWLALSSSPFVARLLSQFRRSSVCPSVPPSSSSPPPRRSASSHFYCSVGSVISYREQFLCFTLHIKQTPASIHPSSCS